MRGFLLFLLILCAGCAKKALVHRFEGSAMTMDYKVIVFKKPSFVHPNDIEHEIIRTFIEIHYAFNDYFEMSEVSRFNRLKKGESMRPSPLMHQLLRLSKELVALTDGYFDPTFATLEPFYKKGPDEKESLSPILLETLYSSFGFHHIVFTETSLAKENDELKLDFGAIAKGFAIDLIGERLKNLGISSAYIEWGGEIFAFGTHPDETPIVVAIKDLPENWSPCLITLDEEGIATSGDQNQRFEIKDKIVTHIMCKDTMMPLEIDEKTIAQVTVKAGSCTWADALATAIMAKQTIDGGAMLAERFVEACPEISVCIVNHLGEVRFINPSSILCEGLSSF